MNWKLRVREGRGKKREKEDSKLEGHHSKSIGCLAGMVALLKIFL